MTPLPPTLARGILERCLRPERRDVVIGDLDEEFATSIVPRRGLAAARWWYWRQAFGSLIADRGAGPRRRNRAGGAMAALAQDLRIAVRTARHAPGFATTVIVTLALGIGSATAIFSAVDIVLLRSLPYQDPDRLVLLWNRLTATGADKVPIPAPDVAVYREETTLFEGLAFTNRVSDAAFESGEGPEPIKLGRATTNLFALLGVGAAIGRTFDDGDAVIGVDSLPGAIPIVLSDGFWRRVYGADSAIVGRSVSIDGGPATIVGVMRPGFELYMPPDLGLPDRTDAWVPLPLDLADWVRRDRPRDQDSDNTGAVIARLRSGVSLAQAQAELDAVTSRQRGASAFYAAAGVETDAYPMGADVTAHLRPVLVTLFVAAGLLLTIAGLNVANLLLVRGTARQRELALRAALGATRGRLARQLLTESVAFGAVGGGLGIVLADVSLTTILAAGGPRTPVGLDTGVSLTAALFGIAVTLVVSLTVGLAPFIEATRTDFGRRLGSRSALGRGQRVKAGLVVIEVGLSLMLLVAAGLLVQTMLRLQSVRPGFDPGGVLSFEVSLRYQDRYRRPAERRRFATELERRLTEIPGVTSAAIVGRLPLSGRAWTQPYGLPGDDDAISWRRREANFRMITADYFRTMGTRLLAGRSFTREEITSEARRIVVIDELMAQRIAPNGSAIGASLGIPLDGRRLRAEVIGVVEHIRHETLIRDGRETIYVPYGHEPSRDAGVVVRTAGSLPALGATAEAAIRDIDADIAVYGMRTMRERVDAATAPTRFAMWLMGFFAAAALSLGVVGLYGLMAFVVSRRSAEIGIRMALGAERATVRRAIVGDGMRLVAAGIALGWAGAVATSRLTGRLVYGVSPLDVTTYLGVGVTLAFVSVVACYVPARRASRIDPVDTLRAD